MVEVDGPCHLVARHRSRSAAERREDGVHTAVEVILKKIRTKSESAEKLAENEAIIDLMRARCGPRAVAQEDTDAGEHADRQTPFDERDAQGCKRYGIFALPVQRHAVVADERVT